MKEKIITLAIAIAIALGINALTYIGSGQEVVAKQTASTELFVVQYTTSDGNIGISLDEKTNAPLGYLLGERYEIGAVVEVTYSNDLIINEKEITGKELLTIEKKYSNEINAMREEWMKN